MVRRTLNIIREVGRSVKNYESSQEDYGFHKSGQVSDSFTSKRWSEGF